MKTPNAPTFLEVENQHKPELIEFEIIEFYERHQTVLKSGMAIGFHEEPETLVN